MDTATPASQQNNLDDEISILDLLLVIAENIKLLVLGPLLAGLVALGVAFLLPPVFIAETSIIPPSTGGGNLMTARTTGYLGSDHLRDELIKSLDLQKRWGHKTEAESRELLKQQLIAKEDRKKGALIIEFGGPDPVLAADIVNESVKILDRLLDQALLDDARERREFFKKQLAELSSDRFANPSIRELVLRDLIQQTNRSEANQSQLTSKLQQLAVAQPPVSKSRPRPMLIATIAALATGFALLLFVFVRQAIRNASQDPESAEKLQKIRRSFSM